MGAEEISKDENYEGDVSSVSNILSGVKSNYILSKIYKNISKKKSLEIVKYNKKVQNRLKLSIQSYKEYFETLTPIELEIIPYKKQYGKFININENEKSYYHIYFNNDEKEMKNKYEIKEKDIVNKIKIIIDYQIKSFEKLFYHCKCNESINFKKFYRTNINNISYMFSGCSSLKKLNLSNFNTDNVIDMSFLFYGCSSLK